MLEVLRNARCVAMPPLWKYFVGIGQRPIGKAVAGKVDASFFRDLAASCGAQGFISLAATGHRLPIAWMGGSFKQQDTEVRRVDDDENGNRLFRLGHASVNAGTPRAGVSISIQNGDADSLRVSAAA